MRAPVRLVYDDATSRIGGWVTSRMACQDSGTGAVLSSGRGESPHRDMLIGSSSVCVILGIAALATYWAWIFSLFHANVLSPFGDADLGPYLALCVIAAGSSALSMVVFALFGFRLQHVVDKAWFSVVLAVLSALMGVPALLRTFGFCLDFPASAAFWAVGALSSSFVYLKTGPFFVWLRRAKLMRCISIAFLSASILYLLAFFLDSVVGIVMIMAFPVASTLCSQAVNRRIGFGWPFVAAPTRSAYVRAVSARARDLVPAIPRTLLYTLIFGVTSYTVLNFAVAENLVVFIGVSILVSAVIFVIFALSREAEIDSDRYRMLLLPLIAIAVLPFPYVPDIYRIFFLALVVFGFTCFDAITWGDLADEIRDRKLAVYVSYAVPTVANFVGIFIGWGTGALLHATLGNAGFDTGFAVFSIVIVIALVVLLVGDLVALEKSATAEPHADSFMEKWKSVCEDIADAHELTNQERKIYLMLVRGRNQRYIASELVISPHTVKTHTYHIYRKVGVHSQQELIDAVEARL